MIGDNALRQLLGDLGRDGRLPLDNIGVIKRRHHDAIDLFDMLARSLIALIEEIAEELDGDELAAEDAGLVDLLLRRRHWHIDHPRHAEMPADEGKALGMVAGGCADEGLSGAALDDHLAEEIEGAADLVGTDRRQILALQPDLGAVAGGKMLVQLQRRCREKATHGLGCFENSLFVHGLSVLLQSDPAMTQER